MSEQATQMSDPDATENARSLRAQLRSAWDLEFSNLRWRLLVCTLLARLLPEGRAMGLRTGLVRLIGLDVGAGTRFLSMPKLQTTPGPLRPRLQIGSHCTIGKRVVLEFGEVITIGDRVTLADGAVVLTTTHQLGPKEHRAGALVRNRVVIGNDVAVGADAIILPGATIGDGACVLPNSVVNVSVGPGVTVSGIPARPLRPT
jgi:carbonic anhydrase/acetyltransferase-like protein (isoleucine patch superfamily)